MIECIFPTPIYNSKIENFNNVQKEIEECIENIDFKLRENLGETHYLSDLYFSDNIVEKYSLFNLKDQICIHLETYCSVLKKEINSYRIDSSWVSLFKKSNYSQVHTHSYSDISGVYYFKTNGSDGNLFFECPVPSSLSSYIYSDFSSSYVYRPEEGKILLFPGWIPHGVTMNQTDNTRISIAFNIIFER